jgi:hypothetical protein
MLQSASLALPIVPRHRIVALILVALAAALGSTTDEPRDPFGNILTENVCYSTTNMFQSSLLLIRSQPDSRQVLFTFPDTAPKVEIQCMNIIERAVATSNILCSTISLLWLCKAPVGTNNFDCQALTAYIANPKTFTSIGPLSKEYIWRIEWDPVSKGEFCYPRDVYFTMIGTTTFPNSGTVGAVVVFTIIAVLVLGIVVLFGGHTLKRHLARKFSSEKALNINSDLPPAIPMNQALQDLEEVEMQHRSIPRLTGGAEFGEDLDIATTTGGDGAGPTSFTRDTFSPSGRVIIPTQTSLYHKSLVQPLAFDRHLSPPRLGNESILAQSGRKTDLPPLPINEFQPVIPVDVHERLTGHEFVIGTSPSPRRRNPTTPSDVLVCADCMLRIQEKATPKYCSVTGKRHF